MPNNLTGDFDVIAQFALPAINRILAAMHRVQRFPHSLAMRVDDTQRPSGDWDRPTTIGVVDAFGDAVADPARIRNPRPVNLGDFIGSGTDTVVARSLDAIANPGLLSVALGEIEPSHLKGRAHLQIFPPTAEITDPTGRNATIKMEILARYIADPGTPRVAEFIRGEIRITAPISQVTSLRQRVISMDIKSANVSVSFVPYWSSSPISQQDINAINLVIRNALKTSFLPSSATLPDEIASVQFKMTPGAHANLGLLIDMEGAAGNPASATQTFAGGNDGFAFALGADYIQKKFAPTLNSILQKQIAPIRKKVDYYFSTYTVTYTVTLNHAELQLKQDKMTLVIKGHAHTGTWFMPDFNFTASQDMTLAPSGDTVELVLGDDHFSTDSTIADAILYLASFSIGKARDDAIRDSNVRSMVRVAFSASANLGGFVRSLLTPAKATTPVAPLAMDMVYTAVNVSTDGIVLHGSVNVAPWPIAYAEYEQISSVSSDPIDAAVAHGPDYSAFKSWIPGGTIRSFEWKRQNQVQGYIDQNKFVLVGEGPVLATDIAPGVVTASSPMCVTIRGDRITAQGPTAIEQVSATICGYRRIIIDDSALVDLDTRVILGEPGPDGTMSRVGTAAPLPANQGKRSNLLVRLIDNAESADVDQIVHAIKEGGRPDAATAVLIIGSAAALQRVKFNENITYVEDKGELARRLGIETDSGPVTALIDPSGKVAWRKQGRVDGSELARVLKEKLLPSRAFGTATATGSIRMGQPAPNFLLDMGGGELGTLRKLRGRSVTLVFDRTEKGGTVSVRIANGAKSDRSGGDKIVVDDRDGSIGKAYGVTAWPATIAVDESGTVRSVRYGAERAHDETQTSKGRAH
ncbi:MAG TPA: hypothetical protein VF042_01495 [Gemmatimonadaceae bacterium]